MALSLPRDTFSGTPRSVVAGFSVSEAIADHAASVLVFRVFGAGLRAVGRDARKSAISASVHARELGPIRRPGGKTPRSIQCPSVTRLLTIPRACKSRKRNI